MINVIDIEEFVKSRHFQVLKVNKKSISFAYNGLKVRVAISDKTSSVKRGGVSYNSQSVKMFVNGEYWTQFSDFYRKEEYFENINRSLTTVDMQLAMGSF